jgi:hypothetical protein
MEFGIWYYWQSVVLMVLRERERRMTRANTQPGHSTTIRRALCKIPKRFDVADGSHLIV